MRVWHGTRIIAYIVLEWLRRIIINERWHGGVWRPIIMAMWSSPNIAQIKLLIIISMSITRESKVLPQRIMWGGIMMLLFHLLWKCWAINFLLSTSLRG